MRPAFAPEQSLRAPLVSQWVIHLSLQTVVDVLRFPQPHSEIPVLNQAHVLAQQLDGLDQRAVLDQRAQRTLE
jgi:hypothetical protein